MGGDEALPDSELALGAARAGDSSAVDPRVVADVEAQMEGLQAGLARLAAKAEAKMAERAAGGLQRAREPKRLELDELPPAGAKLTLFCEFDHVALSGSVEASLLPAMERDDEQAPSASATDAELASARDARMQRLERLAVPLAGAVSQLEAAGTVLIPEFVDFAEACCARDVRLCVLTRGLKQLVRLVLREAGIGHVEVLGNDVSVDDASGEWRVAYRDSSPTGHDKSDSMRRALSGAGSSHVILVGREACDFAPVLGGRVDTLYAAPACELAARCEASGVRSRSFVGWDELAREVFAGVGVGL
jgi:2-hydroxy-3-keto-5-methylthiopentenyl-1-phosphate phosphatase